jgi:transmembrane sensor
MDNYHQYFEIGELIARHIKRELTADEKTVLANWLNEDRHNRELFSKLTDEAEIGGQLASFSSFEKEKAWAKIAKKTGLKTKGNAPMHTKRWFPYAAAFLLLATGIAVNRYFNKKGPVKLLAHQQTDILPGSNKAVLILADGSKIILDEAKPGKIGSQHSVEIDKMPNGSIEYRDDGPTQANAAANALITPRGGQYEVVLEDGTRVWLNAGSSLKYPATFSGNERHVELKGEAYFEVAKNAARPFFVKTDRQTVEVLGTHFNINSYTDEKATRTTLLEGSVRITGYDGGHMIKLKPGQQATLSGKELKLVADPDIDEAIAWKNGKFLFANTDLRTIMRMLSRWYDVDVTYNGPVAERHYRGSISRNVPVSQVFEILKTSGINFTINGRTIIVKS